MAEINFGGVAYSCREGETVLDALLRQDVEVPYSCKLGVCLSCLLRVESGTVPSEAQDGLRKTLCEQGYFLACQCRPGDGLSIAGADEADVFSRAKVLEIERLASNVCRVTLEPATPLYYHAGQFINLRRRDGLIRSYSLASVPRLDPHLELHVKRLPNGRMSDWIFDELSPGESLDIQGPNGTCYYLPGNPSQSMLLIGNGTGLAPLVGILRDTLNDGHGGPIFLYHGTRYKEGLYLRRELEDLAVQHDNFRYSSCLSQDPNVTGCRSGRAEAVASAAHPDLTGWRVFLCGYPPMVHAAKKQAYLAGASLNDIHADPFELCELRRAPRD